MLTSATSTAAICGLLLLLVHPPTYAQSPAEKRDELKSCIDQAISDERDQTKLDVETILARCDDKYIDFLGSIDSERSEKYSELISRYISTRLNTN